jgi:hypothetical protein
MKKETIIAILATVVGIFIILMIIGLTAKDEEMINVPITSTSQEFREGFMEGCIGDDATYQECDCAYTKLENKYGTQGILDLSAEYIKTEQIPADAVAEILVCFN